MRCIINNLKRISKLSTLPPPWKNFCGRPWLCPQNCMWKKLAPHKTYMPARQAYEKNANAKYSFQYKMLLSYQN